MKDLRDKVAFITGGASGLGLGMAKAFGRQGMKVMIADIEQAARNDPRIAELLSGQTVVKVVVVKGRMANFVTK